MLLSCCTEDTRGSPYVPVEGVKSDLHSVLELRDLRSHIPKLLNGRGRGRLRYGRVRVKYGRVRVRCFRVRVRVRKLGLGLGN